MLLLSLQTAMEKNVKIRQQLCFYNFFSVRKQGDLFMFLLFYMEFGSHPHEFPTSIFSNLYLHFIIHCNRLNSVMLNCCNFSMLSTVL